MKKISCIYLLFQLLIFVSCSTSNEIESTLNQVLATSDALDVEGSLALLDKESKEYLNRISEYASNLNESEAFTLGRKSFSQLTTAILYKQSVTYLDSLNTEKQTGPEKVLLLVLFNQFSLYRPMEARKVEFMRMVSNSEKTAIALLKIPTGGNVFSSEITFHKEDGEWKLNLLSSFKVYERILTQAYRKSGLSLTVFADQIANNPPEEVEFRYMLGVE